MASKKPKKKYRPREVLIPKLLVSENAFGPLERVLDRLLKTGEIEEDEFGIYRYNDHAGAPQSVCAGLKIYGRFIEIYGLRTGNVVDISSIVELHNVLEAKEPIEEELIERVRKSFAVCRDVINKVHPSLYRDIIASIRLEKELKGMVSVPDVK